LHGKEHDVLHRSLALLLAALAIALFVSQPILADDTHQGTVVKAANGKLTMKHKDGGAEHSHTLAPDAKVTIDGKPAKLEDLKAGYSITVTTKPGDKTVATKIEAKTKA
jgi:hypothetical protein